MRAGFCGGILRGVRRNSLFTFRWRWQGTGNSPISNRAPPRVAGVSPPSERRRAISKTLRAVRLPALHAPASWSAAALRRFQRETIDGDDVNPSYHTPPSYASLNSRQIFVSLPFCGEMERCCCQRRAISTSKFKQWHDFWRRCPRLKPGIAGLPPARWSAAPDPASD